MQSTEALRQAVLEFPSVVPLLADKAEIMLSVEARSLPVFRIFTPHGCVKFSFLRNSLFSDPSASSSALAEESMLHLLSHIYVQRSHALWKDSARSSWFAETVTELVRTGQIPLKATATTGFARLQSLVRRSGDFNISVYRHVIVLGSSAQRFLPFIPAHVINKNNLACDPLPPPSSKSQYNDDFFRGAEDVFATTFRHQSAARTQRALERLIPDPVFRRQLQVGLVASSVKYALLNKLQDFFAAHPRLLGQFPGGVVQFAQLAGNLPEEVLQEIIVNAQILDEAAAQGALPHGEMPGGLPGNNLVQLDFVEEADINVERDDPAVTDARDEAPVADEAPPPLEEDEEEDEDLEEVGIFLLPLLSSVLNSARLRRCLFVSCAILSAAFGAVPMSKRKARQMTDHTEKSSWKAWTKE